MHGCITINLIEHFTFTTIVFFLFHNQFLTWIYLLPPPHQRTGFDFKQQVVHSFTQSIRNHLSQLIQLWASFIKVFQTIVISIKGENLSGWFNAYRDFDFLCTHTISP